MSTTSTSSKSNDTEPLNQSTDPPNTYNTYSWLFINSLTFPNPQPTIFEHPALLLPREVVRHNSTSRHKQSLRTAGPVHDLGNITVLISLS